MENKDLELRFHNGKFDSDSLLQVKKLNNKGLEEDLTLLSRNFNNFFSSQHAILL